MGGRRFAPRGPVIDTLADEPVEAVDHKVTPSYACRENDRPRTQDIAAIERDLTGRRVYVCDGARDQNLRPKAPRLLQSATREFVPILRWGTPDSSRSARMSRLGHRASHVRQRPCAPIRMCRTFLLPGYVAH